MPRSYVVLCIIPLAQFWYLTGALQSPSVQRQLERYEALQIQPGDHDTIISDALGLSGRLPASASTVMCEIGVLNMHEESLEE